MRGRMSWARSILFVYCTYSATTLPPRIIYSSLPGQSLWSGRGRVWITASAQLLHPKTAGGRILQREREGEKGGRRGREGGTGKMDRGRETQRHWESSPKLIPSAAGWAPKDGIKQSVKEEIRTLKEGIENEAETDKEVDEVWKNLSFLCIYTWEHQNYHIWERATFPFAQWTCCTKIQDEGHNDSNDVVSKCALSPCCTCVHTATSVHTHTHQWYGIQVCPEPFLDMYTYI